MVAEVVQTWATRPPFSGLTLAKPPDRCHPVQATAQKGCYKRSRHTSAVTPRAFTGNRVDYTDPAAPSKGATYRPTSGDGTVTVAHPGDQWHTVWDHSPRQARLDRREEKDRADGQRRGRCGGRGHRQRRLLRRPRGARSRRPRAHAREGARGLGRWEQLLHGRGLPHRFRQPG